MSLENNEFIEDPKPSHLEDIEFAKNPEPRCPVVLLLDTSGSMEGEPIEELKEGIGIFKQEVERDDTASLRVEVAVVTFNSSVQVDRNFVTIDQFVPPSLVANGLTAMGKGIEMALDMVENRKSVYKENGIQYYQPWVFLITDGAPTDDWSTVASRVRKAVEERSLSFFAVGVRGANMRILSQIAHPNITPVKLDGLKFRELFRWLSESMKRVSSSSLNVGEDDRKVDLPNISGWAQVNF